jgi:uncharacterized SAM-binding protein YcdF (DUF218 family)
MAKRLIEGRSSVQHQPSGPARPETIILRAFAAVAAFMLLLFVFGFFAFLRSLDRVEPRLVAQGDGIVALTGGPDRIADALDLLAQSRGQRLLISGVSSQVSLSKIGKSVPGLENWLHCCVDLGRNAQNTVGNAEETLLWANTYGYKTIIVVTSSYHMPRALLELQRHMPDLTFIPAPVVTDRLHDLAIWKDIALLKTLSQEYTKFVVAYARARLTSPAFMAEIIGVPPRRPV